MEKGRRQPVTIHSSRMAYQLGIPSCNGIIFGSGDIYDCLEELCQQGMADLAKLAVAAYYGKTTGVVPVLPADDNYACAVDKDTETITVYGEKYGLIFYKTIVLPYISYNRPPQVIDREEEQQAPPRRGRKTEKRKPRKKRGLDLYEALRYYGLTDEEIESIVEAAKIAKELEEEKKKDTKK